MNATVPLLAAAAGAPIAVSASANSDAATTKFLILTMTLHLSRFCGLRLGFAAKPTPRATEAPARRARESPDIISE